ncbi:MAG: phosphatidylinositol phosphate synthase [Streptosporangiaceae bacterium]
MLSNLRPALARLLTPVGRALARTPITPNAITIIGTVGVSAGALALYPTGHLFAGTVVCTVFVFSDMLDGALARIKGTSGRWGAFLDSTLDRIADASVFGGLTLWFMLGGHDKVLAAVALFCLVCGTLVSYAKARAEGLGLRCDVGIAERTERLIIGFVAIGLSGLGVPYVLPVGLWLLAAATAVTFGQRVAAVRRGALAANGPVVIPGAVTAGEPAPAGHPAGAGSGAAADPGAAGSGAGGCGAAGFGVAGSGAAGSAAEQGAQAGDEQSGSGGAGWPG